MPNITSQFACTNYETVSFGQNFERLQDQDGNIKVSRTTTLVRRKFASDVSQLIHVAGEIKDATELCADNGAGLTLCAQPASAKYICLSDTWEHDEYGPTGYAYEVWSSFTPWTPYAVPTTATGTLTNVSAGCVAPVYGIRSSIMDNDYIIIETPNNQSYKRSTRHSFTITREYADVTQYQPVAGIAMSQGSISVSFGNSTNGALSPNSPNPSGIYILESDIINKVLNTNKFLRTLVWTSASAYADFDASVLNMTPVA